MWCVTTRVSIQLRLRGSQNGGQSDQLTRHQAAEYDRQCQSPRDWTMNGVEGKLRFAMALGKGDLGLLATT